MASTEALISHSCWREWWTPCKQFKYKEPALWTHFDILGDKTCVQFCLSVQTVLLAVSKNGRPMMKSSNIKKDSALLALCEGSHRSHNNNNNKVSISRTISFIWWVHCITRFKLRLRFTDSFMRFISPRCINSPSSSSAYMRQWIGSALIQIMACRYSVPSHYLNQGWVIVNLALRNKLQWSFNQNTKLFIHENASENIFCEMATMVSTGRWVKMSSGQMRFVMTRSTQHYCIQHSNDKSRT